MNRDQCAHVLRTRLPYQVTLRPGIVVVSLPSGLGAIVRPGRCPRVIPTVTDPWLILVCVLTLGALWALFWRDSAREVASEIGELFRRELGVTVVF